MAFLQPPTRQPIFRVPQIVLWLLGGLALAHAARVLGPPALSLDVINNYAFIPARYGHLYMGEHGASPGALFALAAPFVTYMALHDGLAHLAINSLWLLAFGPVVARRFGAGLFLLFFLICGIGAAATHLVFNWGSLVPVVGASGAISGLMAAGIRILPGFASPALDQGALAPILSRQVLTFTVLWAAINILAGLTGFGMPGFGTGGEASLIAWQAHLGGYGAGLVLAGPFDAMRSARAGSFVS